MYTLNCRGRLLSLESPVVMGIINVTPDSFYAGSRHQPVEAIVAQARAMFDAGATIVDIGGQSTRPGSSRISVSEEIDRVVPAIQAVASAFPGAVISVDTYYARVGSEAINAGASIVNDISGGMLDPDMAATVATLGVPFVCMHTRGEPGTMQQLAGYKDVVLEVFDELAQRLYLCEQAGIRDVIVDPGFGFAKTIEQNFKLLDGLEYLQQLQRPILVGLSRKATVYRTLNITADEALNGTTVLNTIALLKGASLLRVHDVREAMQAVRLVTALRTTATIAQD